ncbi:DoxX family protein [Prosthecobacter sp.]|jgi:putative oxidoreductase|uniref:DoxX family protein n=1 Tax=Prosthecobacter sp. TaxID=1965333 RepID=UPI00378312FE
MRRPTKTHSLLSVSLCHHIGLLILRLGFGLTMLLNHGLPYLAHYEQEASHFLPLFGLDARQTLALAVFVEVVASLLVIVGLFTRLAAAALSFTMAVAFVMVHGASFVGEQSGELAFLYFIGAFAISIMGPGRFAWDRQDTV